MKNTLYIFGDSFSCDYNSTENTLPYYYYKEIEDGHIGEYKDIQYFLKDSIGDKIDTIVNTGRGGCSNSTIFENFAIQSVNFKPGDYVSFQSSVYSRFRVVDTENRFIDVNINSHLLEPDQKKLLIGRIKNFNESEIKSLTIERSEDIYLNESINFIKMVRHFCKLAKVNFHIWSIEPKLNELSTLPHIIPYNLRICDKYPNINDNHPSFEGYKFIADKIVNNWET